MSSRSRDHHQPCPCGAELADECSKCSQINPLGSMRVQPPVGSKALNPDDNHPRSPFMVQANEAYHEAAGDWGFDHQRDAFLEGYRSGWVARSVGATR